MMQSRLFKIFFCFVIYGVGLAALNFSLFTYKRLLKVIPHIRSSISVNYPSSAQLSTQLPPQLKKIPFADTLGIITVVSDIHIPGIAHPFNPGLVVHDDGFLMFFRHDHFYYKQFARYLMTMASGIGCVKLNHRFCPIEEPVFLHTDSKFSDDPRVIKQNGNIYIVYNELFPSEEYARIMKMALINPQTYQPETIWHLNQSMHTEEKNWIPFVTEQNTLNFIYSISPHKAMKVLNSETLQLDFLASNITDQIPCILWNYKWGLLRGGTPAVFIGDEYLSFFHSKFTDAKNITWYVMGACTFNRSPPYNITSISEFPLLFKNIYSSKHSELANTNLRCIFPSGMEVEKINGKLFIHVACGENDSAIKIVTIDYEKLKDNMVPINYNSNF